MIFVGIAPPPFHVGAHGTGDSSALCRIRREARLEGRWWLEYPMFLAATDDTAGTTENGYNLKFTDPRIPIVHAKTIHSRSEYRVVNLLSLLLPPRLPHPPPRL